MDESSSKKIAVVILTYNGKHHLQRFLPGVINYSANNCQIIVADNGSTDGTLAFVKQTFPDIQIIDLQNNYGFAEGYNLALASIDYEYSILLNSDVEIRTDWISPIINYMDTNPRIAACQPKILSLSNPEAFEHAGAAGGWIDILGYPFCMGRIFNNTELDLGQYDTPSEIFWASGAAMVIKTDLFKSAGGFDADFFAHMEEIDLCYRLKRMGYEIHNYPLSKVYHLGGGTLPYHSSRKVYLNFRNNLFLLFKNKSIIDLLWILPSRLILDGIAALNFLTEGKTQHFKAVFKAHISFYKFMPNMWSKRKDFNKIKKGKSNLSGIYKGSIIWQYFINRRSQFHTIVSAKSIKI